MTGTTILAIDLGKYKCVACAYDRATAAAEFRTLTTSRAELERLIRTAGPAVVVIEACSLAGWVHDLCAELRIPCQVANTAAEAWKYKHAKRKTDRDDALRLAQLEALGQLPEVVVPAKPVREWRALIAHRQALVTRGSPPRTASAPSSSARGCRPRVGPGRGPRPGWPASPSSPARWPSADRTSCGGGCSTWP